MAKKKIKPVKARGKIKKPPRQRAGKTSKELAGKKSRRAVRKPARKTLKRRFKPKARVPLKTRFDPSQARMELRRLLIALNRTHARDKIGLALLRDEINSFAEKLKRASPEMYAEFELEIKLIYERVFNKITGEHVFVE